MPTNWMIDYDSLTPDQASALAWREQGWLWAERLARGAGYPQLSQAPQGAEQVSFAAGMADFAAGRSRFQAMQAAAPAAVWAVQDDNADSY